MTLWFVYSTLCLIGGIIIGHIVKSDKFLKKNEHND